MSIKPIKKISEFILEEKYDSGNEGGIVKVKLTIDYIKNDIAITPGCGTSDFRFTYNKGSHYKWRKILELIDKAIVKGNEMLDLN